MAGIYRQRHPERTVLYRVLFHHFEEFIAEYENRFEREYGYFRPVTSHIPDKGQVTVRYYGLYSNAHRGKMRKRGGDPFHPPIIEDETPFVPSRGWAEMIKKVYQIDPLICPQCGGRMTIISFIEDHKVIDKIIDHLKLTFIAEHPPPSQAQPQLAMAAEDRVEYI